MYLIFLIIYLLFLYNQKLTYPLIHQNMYSFFTILFPSLFISLVLIDFFKQSNFLIKISKLLFPLLSKIFHLKYLKSVNILLISIFCGSPGNVKLIKEAIENNEIDTLEANKLLPITSTLSLTYILTITSIYQQQITLNIILSYYLAHYIFFFFNNFNYNKKHIHQYKIKDTQKDTLINTLYNSINNNMKILQNIFGVIILFTAITSLIINFFPNFKFIAFIFEINSGINLINTFPHLLLTALVFLSFSIFLQMKNILTNINLLKLIKNKIIIAIIANINLIILKNINLITISLNFQLIGIWILFIIFITVLFSFLFRTS